MILRDIGTLQGYPDHSKSVRLWFLKADGRCAFVPFFFYCSDGFLWLGFPKSEEQCLKKNKQQESVGPLPVAGGAGGRLALAWRFTSGPRLGQQLWRAEVLPPCFALLLLKKNGGSSKIVANTVGGFEVQQILNESKVFFFSYII